MHAAGPQRLNPFPGLRPFRSDEHHLFFGREEQTAALLQLLRTNRFLAVVGTSGSGKSSLVRAGMIAALHGGTMTQAGSTWEVVVLRPGGSPIENLARAFVEADLYDAEDPSTLPRLLDTLNRSRFGLVEAMKQSEAFEPGANLLVVVDQFEELFRFRRQGVDSEESAAAFVNLLLTASEQAECPIYATITMRSDYLGECSEVPGLAEAVNEGEYLIPRLLRDQKRDAIEKPIGVGGAKISPLLVQRLLNDVGDDPDQLPVLQHALMRMWDAWSAGSDHCRPIDFGDFEATGGLGTALSNHADEIYDSLPDGRHRSACEKIFKALTEKGSDNRGIRRPTRLAQLEAIAASDRGTMSTVLDAFRGSGVTFLMPGKDVELGDRTVLDLSHESLMRGWQRLRGWVEEEAQSARIFRRLLDTARLWSDGKAGLFRDPDLQIALSWRTRQAPNAQWAEQYGGHFQTAIGFLESSSAEAEAERQAKEAVRQRELEQARQLAEAQHLRLEQQRRAAKRLRKLIAGLAVVALIAGLACAAALIANQKANTLADIARQNEEQARQNAQQAEQLRKDTEKALAIVESEKAKALAAEGLARAEEEKGRKLLYTTDMRLAPFVWKDGRSTAEQLRVLLAKHIPDGQSADWADEKLMKTGTGTATNSGPGRRDLQAVAEPVPVFISQAAENKGAIAAAGRPDLRGFEWHYYQHLPESSAAVFSGHDASVAAGVLASNGELVTLDENGQVRRWDLSSQLEDKARRRNLPGRPSAHGCVLSPNGRLAALAEGDKVHVFDTSTGKEAFKIDSANTNTRHLIFSPDSGKLVIVDDKIRWLGVVSGDAIAAVDQKYDRLDSLALSADGLTLAVVGHGQTGSLFSIFRLDATTRKATLGVKDVGSGETLHAAALSPDGRRIAVTAKLSGRLVVIDTTTGRSIAQHGSAHASPVSVLAFSGDGAKLATADVEGTIKIWADVQKLTAKSAAPVTLKGHKGEITTVGFSIDAKRLLTTGADKTARVWDLDHAGAAIRPLEGSIFASVARYSPDGQLIAASGVRGVCLWDAASGRKVRELPAADKGVIYSVAFSPADNRLLAVGYGGRADVSYVALWDIDAGTELARLPGATDLPDFRADANSGAVGALAFSPDGKYLVAGFGSKHMLVPPGSAFPLKVWEVATRRLIRRLKGHTGYCVSLDFSRDGTLLASGSRDGTAILWSTKTWKATQTLQNPDKDSLFSGQGMVEDVAFSPDGKTLAMASREATVPLWDVTGGKLLATLKGHSSAVTAVVFSPDGRTLASGSADQTVRLWNVQTRRELMQLDPGSIELGQVSTLAFSPDGKYLLTGGGRSTAFWSTVPIVRNDSNRDAEKLRLLLRSNADFRSRIRMLSENLRLHEALAKLDAKDVRVQAALAAAQANWQASRQAWPEAARAFDRLLAADPTEPEAWLRTPGLLRLATALAHQNRPAAAARLLQGGAKRRAQDGLPPVIRRVGLGFAYSNADGAVRVTELPPGFPESRAGLRVGDTIVKVNDTELTEESLSKFSGLLAGEAGTKVRLTVRHSGSEKPAVIELTRQRFVYDSATGEQLYPLRAIVKERLAKEPRDAGLLELRAELAGQEQMPNFANQVSDYSAAIKILAARPDAAVSADLRRLYRRRGDAYVSLQKWREAVEDYAHVVTDETRDAELLINRALADVMLTVGKRTVPRPVEAKSTFAASLFRLLATSDPAAITRSQKLSTVMNLTDPWQKLVALYQLKGDQQAIDRLVERRPQLAGQIGDLFTKGKDEDKDWRRAIALYSKGITERTTDALLLAKRARAHEALENWDAAAADWSRAASGYPEGAKMLAEFARRLAAGHQVLLAKVQFEKSRTLYQRLLEADPESDPLAAELAQLLWDEHENETAARWTVLKLLQFYNEHALGRFRLSVSGDAAILARERLRFAAMKFTDPWAKLAAAYHVLGDQQAFDKLLKHHPAAAAGIGDLYAAAQDWERAIAEYRKLVADQPADGNLSAKLAAAYQGAGRTREAVPLLVKASSADPKDTMLSAKVAALQAWFGEEKELGEACSRALDFAKGTSDPTTADRMSKLCCLRPTQDKTRLEAALALARKAVELGKNHTYHFWFQMALGMAEYRNGHFAEADAGLLAAAEAGPNNAFVTGTSAFYRAMSLFREGKPDEARKLAIAAAAKMKPLPKDENNPLAGDAIPDDLVLWMAYKEAKALLKIELSPIELLEQARDDEVKTLGADHPSTLATTQNLVEAYMTSGRTHESVSLLAKASSASPKDTILSLKAAALQAWFGQDKELAATRQRILALAKGTSDAFTAERAAKACSILPSPDKAELEAALALGRTAAEVGKGGEWNLLALGMAEYRRGNPLAADKALLAAAEAGPNNPHVMGTSTFYRAMSLFRQGKLDEARRLATDAVAQMKPLPGDEKDLLASNDLWYEDLILWMAYKETRTLIHFDAAPAAPEVANRK